jgi:two-component system, OmpR family, response regulator TrcR
MTQDFKVLLIDDNEDIQNLFELVLENSVQICHTAADGLAQLEQTSPDVVVIDIMLPDLDGYKLLRRIREQNLAPTTKFIATTAYYTDSTSREVQEAGFDGYLPKPFTMTTLQSDLAKHLAAN